MSEIIDYYFEEAIKRARKRAIRNNLLGSLTLLGLMLWWTLAWADVTIVNFSNGQPVTHYDTSYNRLDAHDGGIAQFGDIFYFYGTSYNCGFQWGTTSPFCGFEVYTSADLVTWTDQGKLFNPAPYQTLCGTNGGGCFRPHMIFNPNTGKYVLWFEGEGIANGNSFTADFHAMTCNSPVGPCVESLPQPSLHGIGANTPFSDYNLFVDDDDQAYVIYDDSDDILIDRLNWTYMNSDQQSAVVWQGTTTAHDEAPSLFKRNGIYYAVYGPSCGYCTGTPTVYSYNAGPILGTWTSGGQLNATSCGGQSSNVATLHIGPATSYLYESDLWLGTPNEAAAGRFNDVLSFAGQQINSFACDATVTIGGLQQTVQEYGTGLSGVQALNGDLMFAPRNAGYRGFNLAFGALFTGSGWVYDQDGSAGVMTYNAGADEFTFSLAPTGTAGSGTVLTPYLQVTGSGVVLPNVPNGTPVAYACLDANNHLISSASKCTSN